MTIQQDPANPAAQLPPLPEPAVDGTKYHEELKVCYTGRVHFTAEQMLAYGRLVAQECARMCDSRVTGESGMGREDFENRMCAKGIRTRFGLESGA